MLCTIGQSTQLKRKGSEPYNASFDFAEISTNTRAAPLTNTKWALVMRPAEITLSYGNNL